MKEVAFKHPLETLDFIKPVLDGNVNKWNSIYATVKERSKSTMNKPVPSGIGSY